MARGKKCEDIGNIHHADDQVGAGFAQGAPKRANTLPLPGDPVEDVSRRSTAHPELTQVDCGMKGVSRNVIFYEGDQGHLVSLAGPCARKNAGRSLRSTAS